ncbi:ATP-binding protein [Haploplasma axanthum]|nr:ATP-binding protein [Haploplasma axanthum]
MTLDEIRKRISKDSETKNLKIADVDLLKVNKYLDDRDKEFDGSKLKLITEPYIDVIYVETEATKEKRLNDKMRRNLHVFGSDVFINKDASFTNFKVLDDQRSKALEISIKFVDDFLSGKQVKGIFLHGMYSTGKTYLLSAIANELARKEKTVLFVFLPDLVRVIKGGISSGDMEDKVMKLKQTDVLMIDDLGGENLTVWFRDEIFLPIIQYRLSANLPTLFTSNMTLEQLVEPLSIDYTLKENKLKAIRIIRRISDYNHQIELVTNFK